VGRRQRPKALLSRRELGSIMTKVLRGDQGACNIEALWRSGNRYLAGNLENRFEGAPGIGVVYEHLGRYLANTFGGRYLG